MTFRAMVVLMLGILTLTMLVHGGTGILHVFYFYGNGFTLAAFKFQFHLKGFFKSKYIT